jgi:hypothetical protein
MKNLKITASIHQTFSQFKKRNKMQNLSNVTLYVVRTSAGRYFSGYNKTAFAAEFVDEPLSAKKFTNKHDIKLRPDEMLVEISVDLMKCPEVSISSPFRPQRKIKP